MADIRNPAPLIDSGSRAGSRYAEQQSSTPPEPTNQAASAGTSSPRLKLLEWRAFRKNTLHGFAVVELPSGLIVRDISVHQKNGKFWASLPARPMLDGDGRHVVNHSGKAQYAALLGWRDRDLADRFSVAVVALVRAAHPSDLDEDAAAHEGRP